MVSETIYPSRMDLRATPWEVVESSLSSSRSFRRSTFPSTRFDGAEEFFVVQGLRRKSTHLPYRGAAPRFSRVRSDEMIGFAAVLRKIAATPNIHAGMRT